MLINMRLGLAIGVILALTCAGSGTLAVAPPWIKIANNALYRAKPSVRNNVVCRDSDGERPSCTAVIHKSYVGYEKWKFTLSRETRYSHSRLLHPPKGWI
jgi:hypothetical protein